MTTLWPTKARSNLSAWLKKAAAGENIGILFGDKVIALRPVEVEATDYAWVEYGLKKKEMKRVARRLHAEGAKDRRQGNREPIQVGLRNLRCPLRMRVRFENALGF